MEPCPLVISLHNRMTLLHMRKKEGLEPEKLPEDRIQGLYKELQSYLNRYMKEKPEGHKWIILSSLYLTFIQKRPMHPVEQMKIREEKREGKPVYFCPCKEEEEHTVCRYCVCQKMLAPCSPTRKTV